MFCQNTNVFCQNTNVFYSQETAAFRISLRSFRKSGLDLRNTRLSRSGGGALFPRGATRGELRGATRVELCSMRGAARLGRARPWHLLCGWTPAAAQQVRSEANARCAGARGMWSAWRAGERARDPECMTEGGRASLAQQVPLRLQCSLWGIMAW